MKKPFPLMRVLHCSVLIQLTPEPHWAKQILSAGAQTRGPGGDLLWLP